MRAAHTRNRHQLWVHLLALRYFCGIAKPAGYARPAWSRPKTVTFLIHPESRLKITRSGAQLPRRRRKTWKRSLQITKRRTTPLWRKWRMIKRSAQRKWKLRWRINWSCNHNSLPISSLLSRSSNSSSRCSRCKWSTSSKWRWCTRRSRCKGCSSLSSILLPPTHSWSWTQPTLPLATLPSDHPKARNLRPWWASQS